MAQQGNTVLVKSFEADEPIPALAAVKLDSDGKVTVATTATTDVLGFNQASREIKAGEMVDVVVAGIAVARAASNSVNPGVKLSAGGTGAVDLRTGTNAVCGVALSGATAANQVVEVLIDRS